jgi:hypothetical protein
MELRGVEPATPVKVRLHSATFMELRGVEPLTSAVRLQRSPS